MNRLAAVLSAFALALMVGGPVAAGDQATVGTGSHHHPDGAYGHPSFAALDIDGNGVLSPGEAGGRKGLLDYWFRIDSNRNDAIERSEFAAFEARGADWSTPPASVGPGMGTREDR